MSDNVVALPGFSVPRSQSEPIPDVIEICQELLELARTGKLRGIGVAMVCADPQLITDTRIFSGPSPDRYVLIAAVKHLSYLTDVTAFPGIMARRNISPDGP